MRVPHSSDDAAQAYGRERDFSQSKLQTESAMAPKTNIKNKKTEHTTRVNHLTRAGSLGVSTPRASPALTVSRSQARPGQGNSSEFLTWVANGEEELLNCEDILKDVQKSVHSHWYHKWSLMALLTQGGLQAPSKGGISILRNICKSSS